MTRRLSKSANIPRWQHFLEVVILTIQKQIREVSLQEPGIYLPFVGTLFLVYRHVQSADRRAGLSTADGFADHHGGAGDVRVFRGAALRHCRNRAWAGI